MDLEAMMAATAHVKLEDVQHDCRPILVVYKDGRVERFVGLGRVPPSVDSITGVESKDVVINPETGVSARLYKPQNVGSSAGIIVYYHGGGLCVESAFSPFYHHYCNTLSSKANMIVVSVDYRTAPEHAIPVGYEDGCEGLKWVFEARQDEPWLRDYGDYSRVFLAGDSGGANVTHNVARRVGSIRGDIALKGVVLVHPYFWGKDRIGSEEKMIEETGWYSLGAKLWTVASPGSPNGLDDPQINPGMDPELADLGADNVLVCVTEDDIFRDRGVYYKDVLRKSGWKGNVRVIETLGENHGFHLFDPATVEAGNFMNQIVAFLHS